MEQPIIISNAPKKMTEDEHSEEEGEETEEEKE